ncbi:MAG: type IX secretion system membrane protein PorP/SprF [Flavobacteriales bacterium]|jgi:type IX secretion system PorP/SprF family membrane protein|nr:type IX secretion system membrane protein PorP/SprF [Flavobacteriales bacterium]
MKLKLIISSLLCLLWASSTIAQDSQFTQFYAAPTYLNPAFAGTSVQNRLAINGRNQWPSIAGGWQTYNFAFDHYAPSINSGFGILAMHEKAGSGALRSNTVALQYTYEVPIRRDVFFLPAIQFGYSNRNINFNDLVFSDQIIRDNAENSLETNGIQPHGFFDMGAGALLFSKKYWFGLAVHHLNEPNESLFPQTVSILARKYSAHGGYRMKMPGKFYNRSKNYIVAAFNYKQQGDFNQLDLGAYVETEPFTFGLWYRGLLAKSNGYGYLNQDAVALLVGINTKRYKIGYSYDLTISQLGSPNSGGAHEISIQYEWSNKRNARLAKRRIVPCAKF